MTSGDRPRAGVAGRLLLQASLALLCLTTAGCELFIRWGWTQGPPVVVARPEESVFPLVADAERAARAGLPGFLALARAGGSEELGFEPGDKLEHALLGRPYEVHLLGRDDVLRRTPGEVERALVDLHERVYPVLIGREARTSLVVHEDGGSFRATAFGGGNRIRLYERAREALLSAGAEPRVPFQVVHLVDHDTFLVGGQVHGRAMFTAIEPNPTFELEPGVIAPLSAFAEKLRKVAMIEADQPSGPDSIH
jgi:hypothetical protein